MFRSYVTHHRAFKILKQCQSVLLDCSFRTDPLQMVPSHKLFQDCNVVKYIGMVTRLRKFIIYFHYCSNYLKLVIKT